MFKHTRQNLAKPEDFGGIILKCVGTTKILLILFVPTGDELSLDESGLFPTVYWNKYASSQSGEKKLGALFFNRDTFTHPIDLTCNRIDILIVLPKIAK